MHPHGPLRSSNTRQPSPRKKRSKVRMVVTVVAALTIFGGLVRLAFDDRVVVTALPEPAAPAGQALPPAAPLANAQSSDAVSSDDGRAARVSRAMTTLRVSSHPTR